MSELNERLNVVASRLNELKNAPSNLMKDQLLADLRSLYDAVREIPVVEREKPRVVEQPKAEQPKVVETPKVEIPVKEEIPAKKPKIQMSISDPEDQPVVKPTPEPTINELNEQVSPMTGAQDKKEDKPVAAKKAMKEESVGQDKNTLAGTLNRAPLTDLTTAIPLNEKFGIIRTLFKGNASDFADAVLRLNRSEKPEEMRAYLQLLGKRFGWDEQSDSYEAFIGYVERKMLSLKPSNANSDQ